MGKTERARADTRSVLRVATAVLVTALLALLGASSATAAPYSSHAQLYACCTPDQVKDSIFREAKESGAAYIRLDFEMHGIFPDGITGPRRVWHGPDEVARLSARYQLPVVAILHGVPEPESTCPGAPAADWRLCPPADPARWGAGAREVAERYAGRINHFEIWNEPDGQWAFRGQPEDYARMLAASYDAIKSGVPGAQVLLGGSMYPGPDGEAWLQRAFQTPGVAAASKFDIANIHLRGDGTFMLNDLRTRRGFMARWGRSVPMWVTEHGYPSDAAYQMVVRRASGEQAQADYLAITLPALALNGADQVFVTLRDHGGGEFASEGIAAGAGSGSDPFRRRPAWYAVRDAALNWPAVLAASRRPPPPGPFKAVFLRTSVKATQVKTRTRRARSGSRAAAALVTWRDSRWRRYRVTSSGRFAGPGCRGQVRLTYLVPGSRPAVRHAGLKADCRYKVTVDLRVPARVRLPRRMSVRQNYLGSATTAPGAGPRLAVRLNRPRRGR